MKDTKQSRRHMLSDIKCSVRSSTETQASSSTKVRLWSPNRYWNTCRLKPLPRIGGRKPKALDGCLFCVAQIPVPPLLLIDDALKPP